MWQRVIAMSITFSLFRERLRRTVLGHCLLLFGCITECSKNFSRILSESRSRTVSGLIIGHCKRTSHSHEVTYFTTLVYADQSVAVIKRFIGHDLLG